MKYLVTKLKVKEITYNNGISKGVILLKVTLFSNEIKFEGS